MKIHARNTLLVLATLTALVGLTACSENSSGPENLTADGDWDGSFTHLNVQNQGSLDLSLTEKDGQIGGFYRISFQVRGSTRAGRGGGDVSGTRRDNIELRLGDVMLDGCDWTATLTQQGGKMTGSYRSTCDRDSTGDLDFSRP